MAPSEEMAKEKALELFRQMDQKQRQETQKWVKEEMAKEKALELFRQMDQKQRQETQKWVKEEMAKEKALELFRQMDQKQRQETQKWVKEEMAKEKALELFRQMDQKQRQETQKWVKEEMAKEKALELFRQMDQKQRQETQKCVKEEMAKEKALELFRQMGDEFEDGDRSVQFTDEAPPGGRAQQVLTKEQAMFLEVEAEHLRSSRYRIPAPHVSSELIQAIPVFGEGRSTTEHIATPFMKDLEPFEDAPTVTLSTEALSDQVDVSNNRLEGLMLNKDIFGAFIDQDMSRKEKELWAACRFTMA
eukprot:Skav232633  [mRNA]  locus=scaffold12:193167:194078:+ [translate_table: standard]